MDAILARDTGGFDSYRDDSCENNKQTLYQAIWQTIILWSVLISSVVMVSVTKT